MNEGRRVVKRIFIAVVYLAVFAGLGTGGYFLFRPAPQLPIAEPVINFIETEWIKVFSVGDDVYSIAAKINNPNTNFGADYFSYTFYIYDKDGALIKTADGESFIWPGESKYIISGGINLLKTPAKAELKINEPNWRELNNFKGIDLTLANVNYGKSATGLGKFFEINFTTVNNTPHDLAKTYVSAVVFNKNGEPIAAASTVLENLKSKERRQFSIPWFSFFPGDPTNVDLTVTTNLWETSILING